MSDQVPAGGSGAQAQARPLSDPRFDPLRRRLGSPVLFGVVQGFIAAALYFSLGLTADRAGGWTWLVYLVAAVFFGLTMLSYVEGASMHRERGGATVIARYAFNELWSFVAGWAILLDYLILVALTAFVATDYLAIFWAPMRTGAVELVAAAVLILAVAFINVRGIDPGRFERIVFLALADLAVQVLFVVLGLALLLEPQILTDPGLGGESPGVDDLVFGFTLAIVAITGLDASSGFAGQVAVSRRGLRRLVTARMVAVLVPYLGLTVVASSTLTSPTGLLTRDDGIESPVIGVARAFEPEWLREVLAHLVALSASAVLFVACVVAMLGLSRLGYSLALNRQIPSTVGRLHPRYLTPVVLIGLGTVLALALMLSSDLEFLAGLYAFGACLAFTIVHLAVIALRRREPDADRPFRMPFDVRVRGVAVPVPAVLGLLMSVAAFGGVLWLHGGARVLGPTWMALGLALYVGFRRSEGRPVFRRVQVPERTLTREGTPVAQYGVILVPILGTDLDDDIVQTAGRLAAEKGRPDEGADGAQIEAMWVFEVPMALPLDARLPETDLRRAREALARAKAVGEEYEGVQVFTFTERDRSVGHAIVEQARRRGAEAIVMPAEPPSKIRGGTLLGGRQGLHATAVGDVTRYVLTKAGCRVILTAPPDPDALAARAAALGDPDAADPIRPVHRAAQRLRRTAGDAAARARRGGRQ